MILWAVILETLFLVLVGGTVLGVLHWKGRKKRLPFTKKLLRPPGESLRVRLAELDEQFNDRFVQLFFAAYSPLLIGGLVAIQGIRPSLAVWGAIICLGLAASILCAFRLFGVINLRQRVRLGFEGERHVGEALNQLMLEGYRVFHDFLITDKPGSVRNIDHIVIGPNGIFGVETKTRRKVKSEDGAKAIVAHDAIQYPWGRDQRDFDQVQADVRWLSDWLSKLSQEPVTVAPVLVLPGWFVERRSRAAVTVLSGSEVSANIPRLDGGALSETQVRRLAALIEDRNRSVEY